MKILDKMQRRAPIWILGAFKTLPLEGIKAQGLFSSTNFSTSTTAFNINTSLPAMSTANDIGMDIQIGQVPSNNFKVRGKSPVSSVNISRESSMVSSG